jgi:hypothetical protein
MEEAMAPADLFYTTRTPPGSPGWLPDIPEPPEWPHLEDVVVEYLGRFLDPRLAETALNRHLKTGRLEMAYTRLPAASVHYADGRLRPDIIGPLPEGAERVSFPPESTYGRVVDWAASKFHVRVMPDGSCVVIRLNAPGMAGRWYFFVRSASLGAPKAEPVTSPTPSRPDNDATPEGRKMRLVLPALRVLYPPDGVPPLKRGGPDQLLLKEVRTKLLGRGIDASEKVINLAVKFLRDHPHHP